MNLMEAIIAAKLGGGGGGGGSGTDSNAVHYSADTKTPAERAAALANVGGEPKKLTVIVTWDGTAYTADKTYAEIVAAYNAGKLVVVEYDNKTFAMAEYDVLTARFVNLSSQTVETLTINSSGWTWAAYYLQQTPNIVTDLSSTSITLASAADNTEYNYGELTALTITAIANLGEFSITFTSGSTPTVLTVPNTMIMPAGITVEANTRYEINVKDGYALVAGWAVSA